MKNRNSLFLCVFVPILLCQSSTGCSDNGNPIDPTISQLSGSWVWVRSVGGEALHLITPPAGTIYIDVYTLNGVYSKSRNDSLIATAGYSVSMQNSSPLLRYTDVKTYFDFHFSPFAEFVEFKGDTLLLEDYGFDLYVHTFIRMRE
jgi:hypothetical protein